ncbi:hypothetical protein BJP36_16555 [Moorena producens JHB]|uniref:Uncharacterized protein n=1 Tax=Moorena producens (strain JHB) TaxID=1454205 RepID=A0A1D9G0X9_MOOP1|nr:hypothetical protein [Moorena producens]AOY81276.1 hypothetical protein BJP36_16555 [Moorena producens JHB]
MSNQQPSDNLVWERRIGLALACLVVIAFIVFIFYRPEVNSTTIAVIRFLAALVAALSAYLFIGNIGLEGQLPFTKLQLRAAGSFAVFIAVFFLFFYPIDGLETPNNVELSQAKNIAFLLAWDSRRVLLPDTPQKNTVFATIDAYIDKLGIRMEHSSKYYLVDPKYNQENINEYTEIIYGKLLGIYNRQVANYFAATSNLFLIIAPIEYGDVSPQKRAEIQNYVNRLELPPELATVPSKDLLPWFNKIHDYFYDKLQNNS